eukprot:5417666-Lingulodinium_polyedra.AAC.1
MMRSSRPSDTTTARKSHASHTPRERQNWRSHGVCEHAVCEPMLGCCLGCDWALIGNCLGVAWVLLGCCLGAAW